ncbi:MAG: PQQ-binding-like beta-propeller repeat protein [Bacteroidales bacterium]|nr:PQQ-binding-like beta-propeller repeat protein [Bacteroidales bacterium]MCF8389044.1 PQQ-binding-like beta-propeller repeat protein [Bacteroidales bacterium]
MTRHKFLVSKIVILLLASFSAINAQNWPNWRGPNGDGTSIETNLPIEWDSITNVFWKSPVPGIGHSSPIIWEDRLFTMSALPETNDKILLCYDSNNGKLLWQRTVVKDSLERKHADNSFASGTPATDGRLVYLSVLEVDDVVVAAYDFKGNQVWIKRIGKYSSPHGFSVSPALYGDKVFINGNSMGDHFLAALSKTDGHIVWKKMQENVSHSWSTPIFKEMAGKMQMIFLGNKEIASYNPEDGSKYWYINRSEEKLDFCSTPVYNEKNGVLLLSSAWPIRTLQAIKTDGSGDVTESHVVWQTKIGGMYVPSPICTDDYLYTTMTNGKVHCTDIATGDTLWVEDMGKQYSSPVLADGLVYMPNDEGIITVIKPGPTFEPVARNAMGEKMISSAAISNGKIYLRCDKHLFCIGN